MAELASPAVAARHREDGWGGDGARDAIRLIAEDARQRTGFGTCEVEVLRPDDMLEFVAIAGNDRADAEMLRRASPYAAMKPALSLGAEYGAWTFVAQEWLTVEAKELLAEYCWIPDVPDSGDVGQWKPYDILAARILDDRGHLRALVYLDEPISGRRPSPSHLEDLAEQMPLVLRAILTAIEREELGQQVRLAATAREIVRASSSQLGYHELLAQTHDHLVGGFRADDVVVHVFGDPQPSDRIPTAALLPTRLLGAVEAAVRRSWLAQSVMIFEPGRVWGDEDLNRCLQRDLTAHLTEHDAAEVSVVPIGAGPEALGMIVIARPVGGGRWTESESWAALDIGHDLGRALLNTRSHDREQELIAELRRLDDYRTELISTVSHELRNPLGVIVGHVEMLDSLPGMPPVATTSLRAMARSAGRLTAVVDDLLLLSKMGNPENLLVRVPIDLSALLAEVIEDEAERATQHAVTLVPPAYAVPVIVAGDPEELVRMLANLVNNAVKYSHRGGTVELGLTYHAGDAVFTCTDHGIGVSEADRKQLFNEFFRSTNPEALGRPGTGLGLAIVARIVARHDGLIDLESELGAGSTFRVTLPI